MYVDKILEKLEKIAIANRPSDVVSYIDVYILSGLAVNIIAIILSLDPHFHCSRF